jgi:hypothetical protein
MNPAKMVSKDIDAGTVLVSYHLLVWGGVIGRKDFVLISGQE